VPARGRLDGPGCLVPRRLQTACWSLRQATAPPPQPFSSLALQTRDALTCNSDAVQQRSTLVPIGARTRRRGAFGRSESGRGVRGGLHGCMACRSQHTAAVPVAVPGMLVSRVSRCAALGGSSAAVATVRPQTCDAHDPHAPRPLLWLHDQHRTHRRAWAGGRCCGCRAQLPCTAAVLLHGSSVARREPPLCCRPSAAAAAGLCAAVTPAAAAACCTQHQRLRAAPPTRTRTRTRTRAAQASAPSAAAGAAAPRRQRRPQAPAAAAAAPRCRQSGVLLSWRLCCSRRSPMRRARAAWMPRWEGGALCALGCVPRP
jgi:hypothetical protein